MGLMFIFAANNRIMWSSIFYGIADLFENYLFIPFNLFRAMESWWTSNAVNWMLFVVGIIASVYWMGELKKYSDNGEEDKSISSHSYL